MTGPSCLEDFPEEKSKLEDVADAIARRNITDKTQAGHLRIVRAFVKFMLEGTPIGPLRSIPNLPLMCDHSSPKNVGQSQTVVKEKSLLLLSIRAALTYFYKTLHPEENVTEWRVDRNLATCDGLPTRSPIVSQFMIGLEKTKAAPASAVPGGVVSQLLSVSGVWFDMLLIFLHGYCCFELKKPFI
ncbi:hypothetical protein JB92DRAFT_3103257 [Gautieria morchelliformis]|nr:hypothetical protein JB92DRAFT_3103257 [Gautieria morchelliformis]